VAPEISGQEIHVRTFLLVTGRSWRGTAFGGVKGRTQLPRHADRYMAGRNLDDMITAKLPLERIKQPVERMGRGEAIRSVDRRLAPQTRFSQGFMKPCPRCSSGARVDRVEWRARGSFGFADPDDGIGYAYAPNRIGLKLADDPRERALRQVLYRCLGA
jgi:hypothetical protein